MTVCGGVGAATWQLRICWRATNFEEKWNKRLLRRGRRNQHAGRVCSPELPAWLPHVKFESLHRKGLRIKTAVRLIQSLTQIKRGSGIWLDLARMKCCARIARRLGRSRRCCAKAAA